MAAQERMISKRKDEEVVGFEVEVEIEVEAGDDEVGKDGFWFPRSVALGQQGGCGKRRG